MTSLWKQIKQERLRQGLNFWDNGYYYRLEDQWNWHRAVQMCRAAGDAQ